MFQDDTHDLPVSPFRRIDIGPHLQERFDVFHRKRRFAGIERQPGKRIRCHDQCHGHRLLFGGPGCVQDVFHLPLKQFLNRVPQQQPDVFRPGQPIIMIDEIHHAVAVLHHVIRAFNLNDTVLYAATGHVLCTGFLSGKHEGVLPGHLLLQCRIGHAAPVDAFRYLHNQFVIVFKPAFDGLQLIAEKRQVPQHGSHLHHAVGGHVHGPHQPAGARISPDTGRRHDPRRLAGTGAAPQVEHKRQRVHFGYQRTSKGCTHEKPQHFVLTQFPGVLYPGLQVTPVADGSDQVFVLALTVQLNRIRIRKERFPCPTHMTAGLYHRYRVHVQGGYVCQIFHKQFGVFAGHVQPHIRQFHDLHVAGNGGTGNQNVVPLTVFIKADPDLFRTLVGIL